MPPPSRPAVPDLAEPPFPEDATMFFCIGAQKAGTTWLYDYLSRSDEVHFSPNKELHYFDGIAGRAELSLQIRVDIVRRMAEKLDVSTGRINRATLRQLRQTANLLNIYTGEPVGRGRHNPYLNYLLAGRKRQKIVADITPGYAILDRTHFADMATIGRARFLFILRDPVARMWSQIRMAAGTELPRGFSPEDHAAACRARAEMLIESGRIRRLERGDYLRTMRELEAVVPEARRLYVFYEDIFDGDATTRICRFLDIAPPPADTGTRVNEGASVPLPDDLRAAFREAFDPQYRAMSDRFGDALPARWQI